MKLFVYGTLREGEDNHHLLSVCRCLPCIQHEGIPLLMTCQCPMCQALGSVCEEPPALVTEGYIEGVLVNLGPFPMALRIPDMAIKGEVYEVDEQTMKRIDILEHYHGPHDPRNMFERLEVKMNCAASCEEEEHMMVQAYYAADTPVLSDWKDR